MSVPHSGPLDGLGMGPDGIYTDAEQNLPMSGGGAGTSAAISAPITRSFLLQCLRTMLDIPEAARTAVTQDDILKMH